MSDSDEIMQKIVSAFEHVIEEAAQEIAEELRENLSGPSPSKPGNPPGLDTGQLRESVVVTYAPATADAKVQVSVSTNTEYDNYLEKGTSKMAPRPFAGPLEAKWTPIIENRLALAAKIIT